MSEKSENKDMNTENALSTNRRDPGFWREAWQQTRLVLYLLRDSEVPFYLKLLPLLTVIYVLAPFPFDLLPGGFDDATVLLVGAKVFIEMAPQHVVMKHLNTIRERDGYAPLSEDDIKIGHKEKQKDDLIIDGEIIEETHEE